LQLALEKMGTTSLLKDTGASETEPASSRAAIDVITQRKQAPREQRPYARIEINFVRALM
jgi:hypothetical protein